MFTKKRVVFYKSYVYNALKYKKAIQKTLAKIYFR